MSNKLQYLNLKNSVCQPIPTNRSRELREYTFAAPRGNWKGQEVRSQYAVVGPGLSNSHSKPVPNPFCFKTCSVKLPEPQPNQ